MEGNGGKKEAERERAEVQQGALGLLSLDNISRANFAEFKTTKFEIAERPPAPPISMLGLEARRIAAGGTKVLRARPRPTSCLQH